MSLFACVYESTTVIKFRKYTTDVLPRKFRKQNLAMDWNWLKCVLTFVTMRKDSQPYSFHRIPPVRHNAWSNIDRKSKGKSDDTYTNTARSQCMEKKWKFCHDAINFWFTTIICNVKWKRKRKLRRILTWNTFSLLKLHQISNKQNTRE